jgi:hypothetical protein
VIVRQPALDDITEAVAWYESQRSGLGEELLEQSSARLNERKPTQNYFALCDAKLKFAVS